MVNKSTLFLTLLLLSAPLCAMDGGASSASVAPATTEQLAQVQEAYRALGEAIEANNLELVKLIVAERKLNLDNFRYPLLYIAINKGDLATIKWIFEQTHTQCNTNHLCAAVNAGHLDVIQWMVETCKVPVTCKLLLETLSIPGNQVVIAYLRSHCSTGTYWRARLTDFAFNHSVASCTAAIVASYAVGCFAAKTTSRLTHSRKITNTVSVLSAVASFISLVTLTHGIFLYIH